MHLNLPIVDLTYKTSIPFSTMGWYIQPLGKISQSCAYTMKEYSLVSDEFLAGYYKLLGRLLVGTLLAQRGNGQPALRIHQVQPRSHSSSDLTA